MGSQPSWWGTRSAAVATSSFPAVVAPPMKLGLLLLLTATLGSNAIPVPNGQLGNVEVECGQDTIEIVFLTEDAFQGRIFVAGHADERGCWSRDVGRRTTSLIVGRKECAVETVFTKNPNGFVSSVKVIISFHNKFVTKVDRAYNITCFYTGEGDVVSYSLSVEPAPFVSVSNSVDVPHCTYEVIDDRSGQPADVVHVDSPLTHNWSCKGPTQDTDSCRVTTSSSSDLFCMTVHSCVVNDGTREFQLVDEQGCTADNVLLPNLRYSGNGLAASTRSRAFQFGQKVSRL